MSKFLQKNKKSKIYSFSIILILIFLSIFFGRATWNAYGESVQSKDRVTKIKEEFDELSMRTSSLSQGLAALKTEEGIEKEIRKKFSVAKEGETVVVLVDDELDITEDDIEHPEDGFWGNFFQKVVDFFR